MKIDPVLPASDAIAITDPTLALRLQLVGFLGIMWSSILCASIGIWMLYGGIAFQTGLVALGILMTGLTLHRATFAANSRNAPVTCGHWAQHYRHP